MGQRSSDPSPQSSSLSQSQREGIQRRKPPLHWNSESRQGAVEGHAGPMQCQVLLEQELKTHNWMMGCILDDYWSIINVESLK